jgi:hypothetical protein
LRTTLPSPSFLHPLHHSRPSLPPPRSSHPLFLKKLGIKTLPVLNLPGSIQQLSTPTEPQTHHT